jgi:myo-inositol 2-dehydrogenase/D-chiro-inositol 1-dehydrogenase/scyllo-inositol 2-dehydrogenase (NAD+)
MPKDLLGICLIGCGRAGMIHARNFCNKVTGARMVACADAVKEAARAAAEELNVKDYYSDYKSALLNPLVDCVIVASPTNLHKQIVCDCASAQKHILCEKPMAMDANECQIMIDACEAAGVKLQIGFMRRFDKSFQHAKKLLDDGTIGDLVLIRSHTRGPSKPQPWMFDLKKSNGILAEVNSHDIDSIRWFANSEVSELYAIGGNYRNPEVQVQFPDYYDSVLMNGKLANGVKFSIDGAAYVKYGYDSYVELVGTCGVIHVGRSDDNFVRCITVEHGTASPFVSSWRTLFEDAYLNEDISFVRSILEDLEPAVTGHDGLMAVRIVDAGNRSISSHSIVKL